MTKLKIWVQLKQGFNPLTRGQPANPELNSVIKTSHNNLQKLKLTFFNFGNFGNAFSVVRPALIKLNDTSDLNVSFKPEICIDRQLSRFNSVI